MNFGKKVQGKSRLQIFPFITVLLFLVPVAAGLVCTWLPAFGYLPVVGAENLSLSYFVELWEYPGFTASLAVSLISGLTASFVSFTFSLWVTACLHGAKLWRLVEKSLAPLLAIPHASFAIGFSFLLLPSGWLMRLISPVLTGLTVPPDLLIIGDSNGFSLSVVLILKEIPFFFLMIFAALGQLDVDKTVWLGRSLGYSKMRIWGRLLVPQVFPHLRLPFLAVLAYSLSVVDIAMIAGPSRPVTLAVLINSWFYAPDLVTRLAGAAGAVFLCLVVALVILLCWCLQRFFRFWFRRSVGDGNRDCFADKLKWSGSVLVVSVFAVYFFVFLSLLLKSVALRWRFPDNLPTEYSLAFWEKGLLNSVESMLATIQVGVTVTLVAVILVIGCLEYELCLEERGRKTTIQNSFWMLYIPLIVPQIAFIFGLQQLVVFFNMDGQFVSLVLVHLIFVLPYVFFTLAYPYRRYDQRYYNVALSLTGSKCKSFLRVKLPMLLKSICFSMACGFSVSVVQYLPTLYVGGGRFSTITTETVALASGSDKRVAVVYALLQFSLPALVYALAIFLPLFKFRGRLAMRS